MSHFFLIFFFLFLRRHKFILRRRAFIPLTGSCGGMADAADLGSVGQPPCRFKSCQLHMDRIAPCGASRMERSVEFLHPGKTKLRRCTQTPRKLACSGVCVLRRIIFCASARLPCRHLRGGSRAARRQCRSGRPGAVPHGRARRSGGSHPSRNRSSRSGGPGPGFPS